MTKTPAEGPPELSWAAKALFGVGGLAESLKSVTFGLFLLFYYVNVRGVPGTVIGIVTAVGLVWDALIDPTIGRFSDRLRLGFGNRHAPMLAGALLSGPLFFAVFAPPDGLSTGALAGWLLFFGLLLRSAHSLFLVPYYALGAELSSDYQQRSVISAARVVFVFTGTLAAVVLSFSVFFPADTDWIGAAIGAGTAEPAAFSSGPYRAMGASFGALMTAAGLVAVFGTLDRRQYLPKLQVADSHEGSLFRDLSELLRQPTYRALFLSAGLFFMGSVANATLLINYLVYYAGISDSNSISVFQGGFFIGALIGTPIWMRLARVFDKKSLYLAACCLVAAVAACAYVLVGEGRLIEPGSAHVLAAGNALAGAAAAALGILPLSMLADVADADELAYGRRREATLFGVFSLGHQVGAGLAVALSGFFLDLFARLEPGQIAQTPEAVERIGILYAVLPASIFLASSVFILRYDLSRERVRQVQAELAARKNP